MDADFLFPAALGTCPEPKLPVTGVLTMALLCLTDQPTGLTLKPIDDLCCIVNKMIKDTRPNHTNEFKAAIKANLGFHTTPTVPQPDHLHATPHC